MESSVPEEKRPLETVIYQIQEGIEKKHEIKIYGTASNNLYRLVHPGKLTWNLKMTVWKIIFLLQLGDV